MDGIGCSRTAREVGCDEGIESSERCGRCLARGGFSESGKQGARVVENKRGYEISNKVLI